MTVPVLRGTIVPVDAARATSELLVLGPSLGTTTWLWQAALASDAGAALVGRVRILRFDLPGHGASPATAEPFTVAELADAVLRLVDDIGGGPFHYAGVSFGGEIGIELALRAPERLLSLTVFCGDARIGTPSGWHDRAGQVRTQGTPSLIGATPGRWFAADFVARGPEHASAALNQLSEVDDESYALCCEALAAFDRTADTPGIVAPTLLVSGADDPVTTPAALAELAARIPHGRYAEIAGASHLAVLERPEVAAEVLADAVLLAAGDVDARGMRTRRAVLGDAHVDAAQSRITPETRAFQEFLTRYAWGEVWSRTELGRRERSIATIASLVTGGHENELDMHVRAAIRNGLSPTEIAEVIMHTALYAGLPAANSAFAIAREVFAEHADHEEGDPTNG